MSLSRWSELPNGLQATYNRLASFDPKGGDAMSPESFWRSAVAIGISVAAIWTVADVIAALVGLPLVAGRPTQSSNEHAGPLAAGTPPLTTAGLCLALGHI